MRGSVVGVAPLLVCQEKGRGVQLGMCFQQKTGFEFTFSPLLVYSYSTLRFKSVYVCIFLLLYYSYFRLLSVCLLVCLYMYSLS